MEMIGHLDLCGPDLIEGWLFSPDVEAAQLRLQIYLGDRLIGDCDVNRFRQDLRDAGYGDGTCGFAFSVPHDHVGADFSTARLRLVGTVLYLLPDEFTNFPAQPGLFGPHAESARNW